MRRGVRALDPAERCACRLYPAGVIVPAEGCLEHPEAVTTFDHEEAAT